MFEILSQLNYNLLLLQNQSQQVVPRYGLQAGNVADELDVFYNDKVVSQILDGQKSFERF